MTENAKLTTEAVVEEIAAIIQSARRAADIIHAEPPGSAAAARAFRALQAARAELKRGVS